MSMMSLPVAGRPSSISSAATDASTPPSRIVRVLSRSRLLSMKGVSKQKLSEFLSFEFFAFRIFSDFEKIWILRRSGGRVWTGDRKDDESHRKVIAKTGKASRLRSEMVVDEEEQRGMAARLAESEARIQQLTRSLEEWKDDAAKLRQICCDPGVQGKGKHPRMPLSLVVRCAISPSPPSYSYLVALTLRHPSFASRERGTTLWNRNHPPCRPTTP